MVYVRTVDRAGYLAHLRRDLDAFAACLGADLSAPVAHCGSWTLYDLANHLGGGNLWSAAAVTERRGDHRADAAPRDPAALAAWFSDTCGVLLTALEVDPSTPAWTFFPPETAGFWQRRRCLETLVHRWDAEHAAGITGKLDPELAGDGVAEVIDTMAPMQVQRGRARPPEQAVRLAATDTGSSWVLGPGDPVATASGAAGDLLLMLWHRLPAGDPAITWAGDHVTAQSILAGPLVP